MNGFTAVQIGDGAGHPADAVIAAGGQPHAGEGAFHHGLTGIVQGAAGFQTLRAELGVAGTAPVLHIPGGIHPGFDLSGGLGRGALGQLVKFQGGDLHKQVNAIQQRAGETAEIFFDLGFRAAAAAGRVAVPAAFAGVHGAYQHKLTGVGHGAGGTGDLYLSVLQRLAQNFQHFLMKFRQLVQK